MKRLVFAGSMLAALILTIGVFAVEANTEAKKNESATVEFTETVKLLGVFLKGEYLMIHDEERMAKGEDCTYIYDSKGNLVVSFHCIPVERPKTKGFRIVVSKINAPYGPGEVKEIQFPGSTEAHQVP
ncbi:MAG: hypothetical protein WAV20_23365 [Blastocatellia bacterium]